MLQICGEWLRKLYCSGILYCLEFCLGVAPKTKISFDEDWMLIWLSNYCFVLVRCVLGASLDTSLL
jgi:hypothetical protein